MLVRDVDNVWRDSGETLRARRHRARAHLESDHALYVYWLRMHFLPWRYDTDGLEGAARKWEAQMGNPKLVLMGDGIFSRAECGLSFHKNHKHTFFCAGPAGVLVTDDGHLPRREC